VGDAFNLLFSKKNPPSFLAEFPFKYVEVNKICYMRSIYIYKSNTMIKIILAFKFFQAADAAEDAAADVINR
jgi:hypothetical protein